MIDQPSHASDEDGGPENNERGIKLCQSIPVDDGTPIAPLGISEDHLWRDS